MRFFNPFRWHLCRLPNGKFAARRLILVGWEFASRSDNFDWFGTEFVERYCATDEAAARGVVKRRRGKRRGDPNAGVYVP
jgi:hypothetical protein